MPPFAKAPHTRLLLLGLSLATLTTIAQGIEIPAAWQGVWATETEIRACGQAPVLFVESESDTLCAGDILYAEDGIAEECTGTVSDTNVDVTCVFSEDFGDGCTLTVTIHLVATRNGAVEKLVIPSRAKFHSLQNPNLLAPARRGARR